jgi:hypothetical protein
MLAQAPEKAAVEKFPHAKLHILVAWNPELTCHARTLEQGVKTSVAS